jgi:hypothetical protein
MRPLSASEAIRPAIHRTKAVLFKPFEWGRSGKLAIIANLSVFGAFFLPTPFYSFFATASQPHPKPAALFFSLRLGIISSIVMLGLFYLGARMEFVLFDIVLLNEKFVAPSWRRHGRHFWRWTGFKLLLSLVVAVVNGPLIYVAFTRLVPQLAAIYRQDASPLALARMMLIYGIMALAFAPAALCSSLLTNFVLPSVALEGTTVGEGLRRFVSLIAIEAGPVSLFALSKLLLAIAGYLAVDVAIILFELLSLIPIVLIAVIAAVLLRSIGIGDIAHNITLVGDVLIPVLLAHFFYGVNLIAGSMHIFFQAHALYFLGGRYPMLGDLLEPPVPTFSETAPSPPPLPSLETMPQPPPEPAV